MGPCRRSIDRLRGWRNSFKLFWWTSRSLRSLSRNTPNSFVADVIYVTCLQRIITLVPATALP